MPIRQGLLKRPALSGFHQAAPPNPRPRTTKLADSVWARQRLRREDWTGGFLQRPRFRPRGGRWECRISGYDLKELWRAISLRCDRAPRTYASYCASWVRRSGQAKEVPALYESVAQCFAALSRNSSMEGATSSNSTKRRRSSSATSAVTSRDQPSVVLKATMRAGRM